MKTIKQVLKFLKQSRQFAKEQYGRLEDGHPMKDFYFYKVPVLDSVIIHIEIKMGENA